MKLSLQGFCDQAQLAVCPGPVTIVVNLVLELFHLGPEGRSVISSKSKGSKCYFILSSLGGEYLLFVRA